MRIGEVAERAGVTVKAVRYYETLGLLQPTRRPNGYRDYPSSHVQLVREINALSRLGVAVDETRPFLDCIISGNERGDDCLASLDTYRETIESLDSTIADLSQRRDALAALLASASARTEPLCETTVA
jgi:DNA-binding transcriptional MerR regulator